ncbi:MAG: cytochrome c [Pseudomonadota bacterium]
MRRRGVRSMLIPALALGGLSAAAAQETPLPQGEIVRADLPGRALFAHNCAPCHGTGRGDDGSPMLPGTAALAAKYGATRPAPLELRDDLADPVLRLFVRRGVGAMPAFRPAELSNADIEAIAAYLRATAQANRAANRRR